MSSNDPRRFLSSPDINFEVYELPLGSAIRARVRVRFSSKNGSLKECCSFVFQVDRGPIFGHLTGSNFTH